MPIETLKAQLPPFAGDLRNNLVAILNDESLTAQQRLGAFLASAIASRNATVIKAAEAAVSGQLSPEACDAARTAAAMMSMNNVFYRFLHLVAKPEYGAMPAKLQMNSLGRPGVSGLDFAIWTLAVSAINGCGMCIQGHEQELRKAGASAEVVHAAVRLAAIVHATAVAIEAHEIAQQAKAA